MPEPVSPPEDVCAGCEPSGYGDCEAGRTGPRLRDLAWILALWLAAIAFFWPVLWNGRSLYFRDTHQVHYPQAELTAKGFASGQLPLWEPKIGLGYPFHADPQSMLFYPLAALLLLAPFPLAYNLFALSHVPLAGTFMFLLLRRWGLSPLAAGVGGATLMFSGYVTSTFCLEPHLRALTWMPLAVLAFDCFLESGRARFLGATALTIAVLGSSTDPQYVVFAGFLLACLPWLTPRAGRVRLMRACTGLGVVVLLTALLLAVVYLPLAEFVAASDRQELTWKELTTFQTELSNLYNLVLPLPFPDLTSPFFYANFADAAAPYYTNLYLGFPVLALALAALGWVGRRRTWNGGPTPASTTPRTPDLGRTAAAGVLLGGTLLLISLGDQTPLFGLLVSVVRPLRVFRFPSKYLMLVAFLVPVLAALGIEGLRQGRCRAWTLLIGGFTAAAAAVSCLLWALTFHGDGMLERFLGTWVQSMDGTTRRQCLDTLREAWTGNGWLYLGLSVGLGGLAVLRGRLPRAAVVGTLALVASADLFITARGSLSLVDGAVLQAPPGAVRCIAAAGPTTDPQRILVRPLEERHPFFPRSPHDYFALDSELLDGIKGTLFGLDSLAFQLSVRTRESAALYWLLQSSSPETREKLAAAMGARFTVSPEGLGVPAGKAEPIGRSGPVVIRRLANVSPRVFIAPRARLGQQGTVEEWTSALLGLPGEAIFEPPAAGPAPDPTLVPEAIRECRLAEYSGNRILVDFALEGRGLLVVLDVVYPGWKALVDGQERPILRVGRLFRGVEVRQGERRLEMVYRPWPFRAGAALSLLGLLVALGLMLAQGRRTVAPTASGAPVPER
jgi:hypothetical protein